MRKMVIALTLILAATAAQAATAYFTGRSQYGSSVTGKAAISCEYNYAGQTFWRTFAGAGYCPTSVEVQ